VSRRIRFESVSSSACGVLKFISPRKKAQVGSCYLTEGKKICLQEGGGNMAERKFIMLATKSHPFVMIVDAGITHVLLAFQG
jgi:hypothetical protein